MSTTFLMLIMAVLVGLGASQNEQCTTSNCSNNGPLIKFPFRIKGRQPQHCGYPGFDVSCTSTGETVLDHDLPFPVKLFVDSINYKSREIELYDPHDCLPRHFLNFQNLSSAYPFVYLQNPYIHGDTYTEKSFSIFNCSSSKERDSSSYKISCLSGPTHQVLFVDDFYIDVFLVGCTKIFEFVFPSQYVRSASWERLRLSWSKPDCGHCEAKGRRCGLKNNGNDGEIDCFPKTRKGMSTKALLATGSVLGSLLLGLVVGLLYHMYKTDKIEKQSQKRIKNFLEDYKALKPTRYSYFDIKRITNQFKDKLGQGSYGSVYKGKLSDEISVAVKVLNNYKGNGQEFINEVGTIGRIHHVNVVRLVGFCADGLNRALIYEFLENGSLKNFIHSDDEGTKNHSLTLEKMQEIALGIAKGIEYLHQGCDQRILHFDIKPHNILLDGNLTPKISDFGLAKLCSKDQSIVSMTTARGTMGYIAPEVFSRNFGSVSYKADVYSFGMLLLEMIGLKRKNIEGIEEEGKNGSPNGRVMFENMRELRIDIDEKEDDSVSVARKLGIVGLWCVQWQPADRPSMKGVVQMLEGDGDKLTVPPNPFASTSTLMEMNASVPIRRMGQDLEIIPEIE